MAENTATPKAKTAAPKGVHLVVADGVVYPETSEIKALRRAMSTKGTTQFVEFGSGLTVSTAPVNAAPKADASGF